MVFHRVKNRFIELEVKCFIRKLYSLRYKKRFDNRYFFHLISEKFQNFYNIVEATANIPAWRSCSVDFSTFVTRNENLLAIIEIAPTKMYLKKCLAAKKGCEAQNLFNSECYRRESFFRKVPHCTKRLLDIQFAQRCMLSMNKLRKVQAQHLFIGTYYR